MNTLFEQSGCNYEIQGNYQLPCITAKEQNELHIGAWANRHRQYLKQHHRISLLFTSHFQLVFFGRMINIAVYYPISTSVEKMVVSVLPLSCDSKPGTFSKSRNGGRFSAMIRAISKKTVPRVSSNPSLLPATEKL